jgi:hypothetical protein
MRRLMALLTVMTLLQFAFAAESAGQRQDTEAKQARSEPTRTGKERLGGKASDEQRVDNCNVPLDLRGPTPRPDDCGDGQGTTAGR